MEQWIIKASRFKINKANWLLYNSSAGLCFLLPSYHETKITGLILFTCGCIPSLCHKWVRWCKDSKVLELYHLDALTRTLNNGFEQ